MMILHPSASTLQRFSDGDATAKEHQRLSAHFAECHRCRNIVGSLRDLSAQARALASPSPSPALIDRILADRAAGERIILPQRDDRPTRPFVDRRIAAGLLVAIGAAGYFAWASRSSFTTANDSPQRASVTGDSLDLPISTPGLFLSRLFLPSLASASEPSSLPPLKGVDGRRLSAGQYFFSRMEVTAPGVRAHTTGRGSLRVRASSDAGAPSWHVAHEWTLEPGPSGVRLETESLVVRQRDLRTITRSVHVSPYLRYSRLNILQNFSGDSVSGFMSAERNNKVTVRRPIARFLAPVAGPYMSEAFAPLLLSSVRLHPGWTGSLSLLGWAVVPEDIRYPVQLRVTGEERIRVPAGEFDCWRLEISRGALVHNYWVRKSDGLGIRTRIDRTRSAGAKGNHEIVLIREVK